jgi:hypothetical protein
MFFLHGSVLITTFQLWAWRNESFAFEHCLESWNQIGGEAGFHDVAVGAGSKRFSRIVHFAMGSEKNNLG